MSLLDSVLNRGTETFVSGLIIEHSKMPTFDEVVSYAQESVMGGQIVRTRFQRFPQIQRRFPRMPQSVNVKAFYAFATLFNTGDTKKDQDPSPTSLHPG